MATVSERSLNDMAEYVSEVEAERDSYKDEAAEWKIKYQAAIAELQRVKATLQVA